jgi:hypothetical protein
MYDTVADGRLSRPPPVAARQPRRRHEPGDTLLRGENAFLAKSLMDARRPIRPSAFPVNPLDAFTQLLICLAASRRHLPGPLVVGGTGDREQAAGQADRASCCLLRRDEGIRLHRISFAKKAVARFRMSRSSRRMRFSLRR